MNPFDEVRAVEGEKVIYGNGEEVMAFYYVLDMWSNFKIIAINHSGKITKHDKNGKFIDYEGQSEFDLFMESVEPPVWIVIHNTTCTNTSLERAMHLRKSLGVENYKIVKAEFVK